MVDRLEILDVRVGRPASIGTAGDHDVMSGIAKQSVDTAALELTTTNLVGDEQADRTVHGGTEKAVYCYPADHWPAWVADGFDFAAGSFGENVVVAGGVETEVRMGDVWRWGAALVQVSQPRAPCFKFAMHTGRLTSGPRMIATGRCGWYLRVLEPGPVDTDGGFDLVRRETTVPTVRECFGVMFPGMRPEAEDPDTVARVLATGSLSTEWAGSVRRKNPLATQ